MSLNPGEVTSLSPPVSFPVFRERKAGKIDSMEYIRCMHLQGEQEKSEVPVRGQTKATYQPEGAKPCEESPSRDARHWAIK
jgi:hypothetical protein